ncbi:YbaK/proline-tRNA ligase associated domain protein [Peptoniphilus sp. ING2-D1G]|nr:YbaK/proline-tRNA ligase associated domain protein [Peptoniphilus sp. ING2-D1G]
MTPYEEVYKVLDDLNIEYEVVKHPPALTTEEADKYIEGKEGLRTKTLFLTNKKKTAFYLLVMDEEKRLDMKDFQEKIGEKGLKFASEELLKQKMDLYPGSVTIFGLINNVDKDINVYFDVDVKNHEIITFHPNINTRTLFIKREDMYKFLNAYGYQYNIIEM